MTVCNFFLQGRCRYGERCWNEHPRGGGGGGARGGGGYNNNYNRSSNQQTRGADGGSGNRVWVNPSLQKGRYIQPSSFSQGNDNWGQGGGGDWGWGGGGGGGGGGRRDNVKSSEFSFSSKNRFSALGNSGSFDKGVGGGGGGDVRRVTGGDEDDDKKLEAIQLDMEAWESSGQWGFSCFSSFKTLISGFTDLSPEELRLEYYSSRASGDLQTYINGVNGLLSQWRSRVQELKLMSPATRAALLIELNNPAPQASSSNFQATVLGPCFGSKGFGEPAKANSFSFTPPASGFGSSGTQTSSTGFGSSMPAPTQPPSGFGSSSAALAPSSSSTFSFTLPAADKPTPSGFGSAAGFTFTSAANTKTAFATPATGSGGLFGQTGGGFGPTAPGGGPAGETVHSLFSPESELTPEELNQFKVKRFTLGRVPLKPPPAVLLM